MKIIKNILKWIAIVIAVIILVSFFLPSKCHVERSKVIKTDVPVVFNLVNDLRLWKTWSPWYGLDTAATMVYYGSGKGIGSAYTWSSTNKNVGKGRLDITGVKDNEFITANLYFEGMGTSKVRYNFAKVDNGTRVTWMMDNDIKDVPMAMRPMSKYFSLFMDKMVGPDFEKGLNNMDSVLTGKK